MATPFKLKSGNASAFKNLGSSPMKQDKKAKVTPQKMGLKPAVPAVQSTRKLTDRGIRIANNKEFNAYAREKGILPTFDTSTDEGMAKHEKYYSSKANVNMLNKERAEYFKNKK